mgnify:CR=1 FL=1
MKTYMTPEEHARLHRRRGRQALGLVIAVLVLIGVLPEYRSKGANALIFADLIEQYHRYGFKWAEAMPQMESNKGVQSQWQYLESVQHRRRRCYRRKL